MARASSGKAKLDGMRRKAKGENPDWLYPRKDGNRLKSELKGGTRKPPGQSQKKR